MLQIEKVPIVDSSSTAVVPAPSRAVVKPTTTTTTTTTTSARAVVAKRSVGTSPFARASNAEGVLALADRTREQRKADPRAAKLKFYNQAYGTILTSEHMPVGKAMKSGKALTSAFNRYSILIQRIPLVDQHMPREVGLLEYTAGMPATLKLVKRRRWGEVSTLPGFKSQVVVPLHLWVPADPNTWDYLELTEGKAISFADYDGKILYRPGTQVRLIDIVAQAINSGEGEAEDIAVAADEQQQQQQQHHHRNDQDDGGAPVGVDRVNSALPPVEEDISSRPLLTHRYKAYLQQAEGSADAPQLPFGTVLMLKHPATITHMMEALVRRQLMVSLGQMRADAPDNVEEIYQINARNQAEYSEAYTEGPVKRAFSFLALTEPGDRSSLVYTNVSKLRFANYSCVAEGVVRSPPDAGVDFMYLVEVLFKSQIIWDMFGTPNADKWAGVIADYMTLISFFALLSTRIVKSADMFTENAEVCDKYLERMDVPAIQAGTKEPVVDLFSERIYLHGTTYDYKAFAYANLVFMDPNQLWRWTIPVTADTLNKIVSRWNIPEGQRVDSSKFRENPEYTCIGELRVNDAKMRYSSVDKQKACEYRVMIANPARFIDQMPLLSALSPEHGSVFIETVCFFDPKSKSPPSLPEMFAREPFNFTPPMMFAQNTDTASQCVAYVFSESEKWRNYRPENYAINEAGAIVPLAAAAGATAGSTSAEHEHQAHRYDRERDRSPPKTPDPFGDD